MTTLQTEEVVKRHNNAESRKQTLPLYQIWQANGCRRAEKAEETEEKILGDKKWQVQYQLLQ